MQIQLWSYNYDPEPSGIAPLSTVFASELAARGHLVTVVAAHPHYPEPRWGSRVRPYRERRDGIEVLRLPLRIGRASTRDRVLQEASFTSALSAAAPWLPRPDVLVAVSPSFPALAPAMLRAASWRVPFVLWLQDILPDGAAVTGMLSPGRRLDAMRRFERLAYARADRIVVISDSFRENLRAKGVPDGRIARIYNPASRYDPAPQYRGGRSGPVALTMGNIGHTQNLVAVTQAFERSRALADAGARFVVAGDGVVGDDVRAAITTDRVQVTGILDSDALEQQLAAATVAVVSQRYEGIDFNVPSKLMNFMAYGLPVVATVRPDSEVARIVAASGAGWVSDCADVDDFSATIARVLGAPDELRRRGLAGANHAAEHFSPARFADRFEGVLEGVLMRG